MREFLCNTNPSQSLCQCIGSHSCRTPFLGKTRILLTCYRSWAEKRKGKPKKTKNKFFKSLTVSDFMLRPFAKAPTAVDEWRSTLRSRMEKRKLKRVRRPLARSKKKTHGPSKLGSCRVYNIPVTRSAPHPDLAASVTRLRWGGVERHGPGAGRFA